MTNEEMQMLIDRYFNAEGYTFPDSFEHRVDPESSAIMYSLVRRHKPKVTLHIGTWRGGSTCVIMAALIRNRRPFKYVASELLEDMRNQTKTHCMEKNGRVPEIIGDITKNLKKVPPKLDFLFLDSDHDAKTTLWIVKYIFPRLKKGGLFILHDWAVREAEDGSWFGKGAEGAGGWPETQILIDMHNQGHFPFEKVYWNYLNPSPWELGAFTKK